MQSVATEQTVVPVRAIMTTDVATTSPETTVDALARALLDGGYSGLPVVDAAGALIGMVSEYDVISKRGATVGEIMSRGVISVAEETGTDEIAGLMGLHGIRRVPVVRAGFRVVESFEASDRGAGGFGSTGR